jgi:serine/threonine-protein kinase
VSLSAGTRLGPYEIVSPLGAGGMGEVYRARDTKLGREVAIKVLPEALAFDSDRIARFEREAKVLASLNHPHIAALHGMEQSSERHFLVMELVEGETLAERLRRGAMPADEALTVAQQIADALEAAHEKGIVHRDLKPANVKITPDEKVKVLDFGLAKAMEPVGAGLQAGPGALTHSPTLSMMATQAGVIIGTAAYMSPEQAKGFPADQRSDVFSFGSVLYEMLTGRQPFQGDTAPDILASVLAREPDLTALPPNLNPRIAELLRRCLEKNPKRRWQAVGAVRAEIEAIAAAPRSGPASAQALAPRLPLWRRAMPTAVAALAATGLTAAVAWNLRPSQLPLAVSRFAFTLPDGQQFTNTGRQVIAISPDGSQMVYVANQRLYVRSMAQLDPQVISGTQITQGILNPVFSPDGRSIAFYSNADRTLKRIAISGGAAVTLGPAGALFGMSWGPDGIAFGQGIGGIMRVSENGGKPELLVSGKDDEVTYGPQILPGGEAVLFTIPDGVAGDRWDRAQIVVQSLESGERKVIIAGGSDARYLPTGHIVYALGGTLLAVPFDLARLEVLGGPVPIVEGVSRAGIATGTVHFDISDTGSLIYIPGPTFVVASAQLDIALTDRNGGVEPLNLPPGPYQYPRVSPDGKRIAFGTDDAKEAVIWIHDLAGTSAMRRLTFGGRNRLPVWSSDDRHVAFQSDREGDLAIFWQSVDGTGTPERLTTPDPGTSHAPESWSPDGEQLLFSVTTGSSMSLWTLSLQDRKAMPFGDVQSTIPSNAVFSPNGRWVAYSSNEGTGIPNVYVQPFPATGAKYQILSNQRENTNTPLWSPNGDELYYIPRQGGFAVVRVTTEPAFAFGKPVDVPRRFPAAGPGAPRTFDITPDGKIVGVVAAGETESGEPTTPHIHVVLNWFEELKQRVPIGN